MSLNNSIVEDFDHLFLEILFQEKDYDWNHHLIPSIRGKPKIRGHYQLCLLFYQVKVMNCMT